MLKCFFYKKKIYWDFFSFNLTWKIISHEVFLNWDDFVFLDWFIPS